MTISHSKLLVAMLFAGLAECDSTHLSFDEHAYGDRSPSAQQARVQKAPSEQGSRADPVR